MAKRLSRREIDRVGVRSFLALGIGAMAGVLHEGRGLAQFAIGEHGKDRDAAAGVVRHQHVLSGFVDGDVAGIGAARGDLIQKCQLAGGVVDGERAHAAAVRAFVVADFVDRVEKASIRVQRDERGIGRFRGQAERRDLAGGGVVAVGVDAFALAAFFGVGADVEEIGRLLGGGSRGGER